MKVSYNFKLINSNYPADINKENFGETALQLFRYQYEVNDVYRQFVQALKVDVAAIDTILKIPFLPISFFKTHQVVSATHDHYPLIFESSGTTGEVPSRHYVYDEQVYERSLVEGFASFYGDPSRYTFLALLPSYLERMNASLVHMARVLMDKSGHKDNGFYLHGSDKLGELLGRLTIEDQPVILLGVTFALLDMADAYPMDLGNTIVMETGGMKGRRTEWTRAQVHEYLKERWQVKDIHSEYGMTELLSQAYALKDGVFEATPTMKVLVRDINDPLDVALTGTGCLNIIDLANVHSCAFIATDDIGTIHSDHSFEVLGRVDHSALRGCNLMVL